MTECGGRRAFSCGDFDILNGPAYGDGYLARYVHFSNHRSFLLDGGAFRSVCLITNSTSFALNTVYGSTDGRGVECLFRTRQPQCFQNHFIMLWKVGHAGCLATFCNESILQTRPVLLMLAMEDRCSLRKHDSSCSGQPLIVGLYCQATVSVKYYHARRYAYASTLKQSHFLDSFVLLVLNGKTLPPKYRAGGSIMARRSTEHLLPGLAPVRV